MAVKRSVRSPVAAEPRRNPSLRTWLMERIVVSKDGRL